jgi:hypothetical protein
MPQVRYVPADSILKEDVLPGGSSYAEKKIVLGSRVTKGFAFYERDKYVSIEASHFTKAINTNGITWKILPDHGRTLSAVTPFPVTAALQKPAPAAPRLEYEIHMVSSGDSVKVQAYFSPSLNFHNDEGLRYGISIDEETPQIISINKEDNNTRIWNGWMSNNIIIKTSSHYIAKPGKHVLKFWMVNPGVVLQKIVVDAGGVKPSYLGPPETLIK